MAIIALLMCVLQTFTFNIYDGETISVNDDRVECFVTLDCIYTPHLTGHQQIMLWDLDDEFLKTLKKSRMLPVCKTVMKLDYHNK